MSDIDISIVIEWENTLLADDARPRQALPELARQAAALRERCEILFMHNPAQVSRDEVAAAVAPCLKGSRTAWRIESAPGLHYYELKNAGARLVRGDIVVFLDSDVIVESGWLPALIAPFGQSPEIAIVAGNTYVDAATLTGKALAEGWFFPPRSTTDALTPSSFFFPNNVAFRRDFLLAHPYPPMRDGATRGACVALTQQLHAEGVTIWLAGGARASHPPPNGLRHLAVRALAEGRDWAYSGRLAADVAALRSAIAYAAQTPQEIGRMIRATRARLRVTGLQSVLVMILQCVYCTLRAVGAVAAILAPSYARRAWRI